MEMSTAEFAVFLTTIMMCGTFGFGYLCDRLFNRAPVTPKRGATRNR